MDPKNGGEKKIFRYLIKLITYIVTFSAGFFSDHFIEMGQLYDDYFRKPVFTYRTDEEYEYVVNGFDLRSGSMSLYPQLWVKDAERTIRRIGLPGLYKKTEKIIYDGEHKGFAFDGGNWELADQISKDVCGILADDLGNDRMKPVRCIKVFLARIRYSNAKSTKNKERFYLVRVSECSIEEISREELEEYLTFYEMNMDREEYDRQIMTIVNDCEEAMRQ